MGVFNPAALREAEAGAVLDLPPGALKSSLPGVRPRRGRRPSCCHLGAQIGLKPSKSHGFFLRHFRFIGYLDIIHHIKDRIITILGPSWAILGPSWAVLGPSWGDLGRSWGHLGTILAAFWAILGPRSGLKTMQKPWFFMYCRFIGQLQTICIII